MDIPMELDAKKLQATNIATGSALLVAILLLGLFNILGSSDQAVKAASGDDAATFFLERRRKRARFFITIRR